MLIDKYIIIIMYVKHWNFHVLGLHCMLVFWNVYDLESLVHYLVLLFMSLFPVVVIQASTAYH